eukprot:9084541-Heterocapsa_arctica.AAC.1
MASWNEFSNFALRIRNAKGAGRMPACGQRAHSSLKLSHLRTLFRRALPFKVAAQDPHENVGTRGTIHGQRGPCDQHVVSFSDT